VTYTGFRSLKRSKPPIGVTVEVMHMITGAGAPEREGWTTLGRLRSDGSFSLSQNEQKSVDMRPVTHWRFRIENPTKNNE